MIKHMGVKIRMRRVIIVFSLGRAKRKWLESTALSTVLHLRAFF